MILVFMRSRRYPRAIALGEPKKGAIAAEGRAQTEDDIPPGEPERPGSILDLGAPAYLTLRASNLVVTTSPASKPVVYFTVVVTESLPLERIRIRAEYVPFTPPGMTENLTASVPFTVNTPPEMENVPRAVVDDVVEDHTP